MRLYKAAIPIGALTLALSVGGSVANAAQREGHNRGNRQSEQQARPRNDQQRSNNQGHVERQNDNSNQGHAARGNDNGDNRSNRDVNHGNDRRDNGFRGGYTVRPRVEVIRPRVNVVRPRFAHRYGPNLGIFFGAGSGFRYGSPYYGRVYGYVPAPVYGARIYYGDVRLQVRPRDAQVFVDGYYAGVVDDFDGVFQRLTLTVGPHEIEIEEPGLEPQVFNVMVDPSRTVDVRADLYPDQP